MGLVNSVAGICWKCTEMKHGPDHKEKGVVEKRMFELTRGMVTRPTPTGTKVVDVRDVMKCYTCGELVPLESWREYQNTGDIIIRKQRKGDPRW